MPRQQRIAYEGAWYHVFNRAAGRKTICFTESNFKFFLGLLEEVSTEYEVEVHAYCMMKNHFHLLFHTPKGNISETMWHFGKKFASYLNKEIHADGPLFRSRFRSVLIDSNSHLLNVARYIHMNPVSAGICEHPGAYSWSSFIPYINQNLRPNFLKTTQILSHFCAEMEFENYHLIGIDDQTKKFYHSKRIRSILGGDEFLKQVAAA